MEEATEHQQPVDSPADEDQLAQPQVDVEPNLILSYSASPKRLARRIQGGPSPPLCSSEPKEEESFLQDGCNTPQNITQSPSSKPAQPSQPSQSTGETETDVPDDSTPQNITQSPSSEPAQPSQPTVNTETDVPDDSTPQNTVELSARESLQSDPLSQTDVELLGKEDPKLKQPISLSEIVCKQSRDTTSESSESAERKPTQLNPQSPPPIMNGNHIHACIYHIYLILCIAHTCHIYINTNYN